MKKKLLFAAIISFFTFPLSPITLNAQNRFDASVFAGLNMSQIDGDNAGNYNHLGLRAGVGTSFTLGHDLQSPWRMVTELAFTQKGSYVEQTNIRMSANYVELSLLLSYNALDNRLRLAAGVAPAILVGASATENGIKNAAWEDNFKTFDLLPLTAAVRYLFTDHLAIEARYQNSMLSVTKHTSSGIYRIWKENKGNFSRLVTVGLAYQF